jgi:uncharacterized glyoxalase superfamily protein PhnB
LYVIVSSQTTPSRALYARVMEIEDQDYGGRLYSCRDPEGHLWNFGTYDPWA